MHSTDLCVHIFPVWRAFCFLDKTQHFISLQGFSKLNTKPSDSETEIFVGHQKTVFYQITFYKGFSISNMTPSDSEAELRWLKAPNLELSAASAKFANWFQHFSSLLNCSKRTFLSNNCPTVATRGQS